MNKKLLAQAVFLGLVFVALGHVALGWTPDQRVGYGVMAFGIVVLLAGFAAAYISD